MDSDPKSKKPPENLEKAAEEIVDFLKDSDARSLLKDFIVDTYKRFESESVERLRARVEHEAKVDASASNDFHKSGNVEPLLSENLSMHETERAFARGVTLTKKNLVRSVEDRVEEINRLLAGIGGFSSQLKSTFARSTVVFLEQEDPKHSFRERLIFSIHLPNYELKRSMAQGQKGESKSDSSGRTPLQATWDDAVNALARIIETAGLKPKYVKNDRKFCRFVMKQDLRNKANLPDEYFSLTLDYNTEQRVEELKQSYNKILADYEMRIAKWTKSVKRYPENSRSGRYLRLRDKLVELSQERDFFVGTVPDPNQLDEGVLFLIEVCTQKDYHIVKDRMQSIMTKFILHLSKIAAHEAEIDPDLEYELWKTGRITQKKDGATWAEGLTTEDIESVQEYEIDSGALSPVPKKKAA